MYHFSRTFNRFTKKFNNSLLLIIIRTAPKVFRNIFKIFQLKSETFHKNCNISEIALE